jgi:hypothetical protein
VPAQTWDSFWRARGVSPAPPQDFLELPPGPPPRILNLTDGAITDDTALRWSIAYLRRESGDAWAYRHMRLDIVNAGVLGPPGLNGTANGIEAELARGTVEIEHRSSPGAVVAIAVIAVPVDIKRRDELQQGGTASVGLTDFVLVNVFTASGLPGDRILADGTREPLPAIGQAGALAWQLNTGEFRDDPVVGPLWYQARGWNCSPRGSSDLARLCALVQPPS